MNQEPAGSDDQDFDSARREMVARQIRERGIHSPSVLAAMQTVPRHQFIHPEHASEAYADKPLPIGENQTISQPFMVAAMTEALCLVGPERVLEIGAGSGYQTAILSMLAREITAIESQSSLAAEAKARLERLGYSNVRVIEADGSSGWPDAAPYDAILVAAAAPSIPSPLVDQLAEGGRLIIPVGDSENQELVRITKKGNQMSRESLYHCRFVPLIGRFGWQPNPQEFRRE